MWAEIIDRSKRMRGKIKSRLLLWQGLFLGPTYESNECDIIIDGDKKITSNITMAIVANGKFLGGGFNDDTQSEHVRRLVKSDNNEEFR